MDRLFILLPLFAPLVTFADAPETKDAPEWTGPFEAPGFRATGSPATKPPDALRSLTELLSDEPFAREVALPALDVPALLAEDAQAAADRRPPRIGVARALSVSLADGQWHALPDGAGVWTIAIAAEDAIGLRLHFSAFDLPEGAAVRLASAARPDAVDGPFERRGPFEDGAFWSTVLVGERVYLEYVVPLAGGSPPSSLPFEVDQIQHLYRDPLLLPETAGGECHNDVTCHPAWSDVSDAVARYTYIDSTGSHVCSGQLINTQNSDQTPYFLTAAHCVRTQTLARTMVFYWTYQTSVCGGLPPGIEDVPSSAQAEFLSADQNNDISLVMVIGELPAGLFWAGWDANPVPSGTPCACIHHPLGEYKRISFGTQTDEPGGFLRIAWSDGVTEPGSSGSGAFLASSQSLVGVLSAGASSCGGEPQDQYDWFGPFAQVFPLLAPFLQAGSDDVWEPNGDCGSAPEIPPGAYNGLIVKSTNEDWYRLRPTDCGELSVSVWFTDAHGDIDIELYEACSGAIVAASRGSGNAESVTIPQFAAGDFWLRVYLNSGTRNRYGLAVSLQGDTAHYAASPDLCIPDNDPTGIQHAIDVPEHVNIADLNVALTIPHTWNGDIRVRLTHGATTVTLIERPGHPSIFFGFPDDGFDVILDDSASAWIETSTSKGPPLVGTFRPHEPLSAFNGRDAFGTWTLTVSDNAAQDRGRLQNWMLFITQPPAGDPCECGGDGDITGDGSTDLADTAAFQRCFTGAGVSAIPAGCEGASFDCDTDVDLSDWWHLASVLTGPRSAGSGPSNPGSGASPAHTPGP